jgi:integrase
MPDLATIRAILPNLGQMEACVARQQYQRPSVLERNGNWCIRPRVAKLDPARGQFVRVQTWITLGRVGAMTLTNAKKEADRIMTTINDGSFVATSQLPFAGIIEKYIEARVPLLGDRTQGKYRAHLKNHIVPAFGSKRLADIDTQAIEAWLTAKRGTLSDATRADLLHIMSAVFTAAAKWKYWAGDNPCKDVELGRHSPVREKRLLTIDETHRFFACIANTRVCTAECAALIAKTAAATGLRVSELLGLQWGDIGADSLTVRRRAGRGSVAAPKSAKARRTVQIAGLAAELQQLRAAGAAATDWVFSKEGKPLDDRDLQQHVFRPAAELAGVYVEGFGLHWLRAMNITLRQKAGASAIQAAQEAGHAKVSTTAIYTLADPEAEARRASTINAWLADTKGKPS